METILTDLKGDVKDSRALLKWQSVDNSLFELDENTLLVSKSPCFEQIY